MKKRKNRFSECVGLNRRHPLGGLYTPDCDLSSLYAHRDHLVDARTGSIRHGNLESHVEQRPARRGHADRGSLVECLSIRLVLGKSQRKAD